MFMGILNARHNFLAAAVAPMFYNVAIIVGALLSDDVRVLAFAVVIGALLHLLVQIPALVHVGMRWQPVWDWRDAAVREVGRLMGPRVVGLAAYHLNFVVATFFASTVGGGAISAVNYAWLIVMTPLGLFGMALSTALFPRLAEQAVRDEDELRATVSRALRLILYLTIPASVGLMVTAGPLTALLLRGGAFDTSSSDLVVGALVLYALGLFAHSGIEILSRGFYALADTRTPVTFAVLSMVINLVLCLVLVNALEVNGLALSLSIAAMVEFVLLARAFAVRLGGLESLRLARSVLRTVASTLVMTELVGVWLVILYAAGALDGGDKLLSGVAVAGAIGIGAPAFYVTSRALRSPEAQLLADRMPIPVRLRRLGVLQGSP
jgi:putative peptidoglycan lipid II flippase